MKLTEDYRKNVKTSLKIMQTQRAAIYEDVMCHYSALYNGLHEVDSEKVRALLFEAYILEWMDRHWEKLTQITKNGNKKEQHEMTVFFASYFSDLMQISENAHIFAAASELLKAQRATVGQLIEYADKWDESCNQLQVNLKKHKAHYKKLIESAKNAKQEEKNGIS